MLHTLEFELDCGALGLRDFDCHAEVLRTPSGGYTCQLVKADCLIFGGWKDALPLIDECQKRVCEDEILRDFLGDQWKRAAL